MDHPDGETQVHIELVFLALDRDEDVNKLQSLELTGCHINEAAEIPKGVLQMLKSRIDRYPAEMEGGAVDPFIMCDYNSVPTDHWLYSLAEETKPVKHAFYHQPPALQITHGNDGNIVDANGNHYKINPEADNLGHYANGVIESPPTVKSVWFEDRLQWWVPHLSEDYYADQVHGADPDWVNVMILNNYGEVRAGKPVYPEYLDGVHYDEKLINPLEGIPIIVGMDLGLCYTDDHEVLTKNGWKFFKDVDENKDWAATRNPISNNFEYTPINFKVEEDHDGDMLEWSSQNVNFCVTPEHLVPISFRDTPDDVHFKTADWLASNQGGHHYVDLVSNWIGSDQVSPVLDWSFETYCTFMGWYLSEGSGGKNDNRVCITQKEVGPELESLFKSTQLKWSHYKCQHRSSNKELAVYLKQFGTCKVKFVPQEIKDAKPEHIKLFIDAFTSGDGHIRIMENGAEEHTLFTTSKQLSDDFQELAQKVGWYSSLVFEEGKTSYYKAENRFITGSGGYTVRFKKRATRAELLKKNFRRVHYQGKRYCLNVPYHTLYIRRNGRPSWNGNTPAAAFMQLSPTGQLLIFDEIVTEDCSIHKFCEDYLKPHILNVYPKHNFTLIVDPAAVQRSSNDLKSAAEIIGGAAPVGSGLPYRLALSNNPLKRREAVVLFLRKLNGFSIGPNCQFMRKGFISGYAYDKKRIAVANVRATAGSEMFKDKPGKNIYSHIHDAIQYGALELSEGRSIRRKPMGTYAKSKHQPADYSAGY